MGSQAVRANTIDAHRHDIADLSLIGADMNRLQIGGTAD
jgi:hypothetical protein